MVVVRFFTNGKGKRKTFCILAISNTEHIRRTWSLPHSWGYLDGDSGKMLALQMVPLLHYLESYYPHLVLYHKHGATVTADHRDQFHPLTALKDANFSFPRRPTATGIKSQRRR